MSLKFEDLTVFDLNLLKSSAIEILIFSKSNNRYEALVEATLSCIYSKGYLTVNRPTNKELVFALTPVNGVRYSAEHADAITVISRIFNLIENTIVKDETREPTWSTPRAAWYTPYVSYKKPWMF